MSGTKSELIDRLITRQEGIEQNNEKLGNGDDISIDDGKNNSKNTVSESDEGGEDEERTTYDDPMLSQLPTPVLEAFLKYTASNSIDSSFEDLSQLSNEPKLLPIQQKSYDIIADGKDAVLFAPTGTGKTLGFVLPLAARLWAWKRDGSLASSSSKRTHRMKQQRKQNKNDSYSDYSDTPTDPATPSILVIEPSRELARQVGKVWSKFHPTSTKNSKRHVVTVYGGVPMTRHAALLDSKVDVVIGTPGRIRELIREKYLSTSKIRSIVLDEADTLLNFKDVPEVEWLLEGMREDYQLVLASATVNTRVEKFVEEVMELEVGEEGYVVVDSALMRGSGVGHDEHHEFDDIGGIEGLENTNADGIEVGDENVDVTIDNDSLIRDNKVTKIPKVRHWSMAASTSARTMLASDIIVTMKPRRGIVFVASKAEVELVALQLSERLSAANDVSVHVLHGDMVQAARARTVAAFREDVSGTTTDSTAEPTRSRMTRIMVATDVASRGLDLPAVDLVVQFGIPRDSGKDGTYDPELYIHRTGRAGRFGTTRTADAIVLFDRTQGEGMALTKLQDEMKSRWGIEIESRALPSPKEVTDASYERAFWRCDEFGKRSMSTGSDGTRQLVQHFMDRMTVDLGIDIDESDENSKETELLHRLATAMAALSGLEGSVPLRSLLTADPRDRTLRVWTKSCSPSNPLSPPEVTKLIKGIGSGKLGRISICEDGSAVFDLGAKKAERLLKMAAEEEHEWFIEIPESLPSPV